LPEQFSENDLAAVIVEMVRTLPDSLMAEVNEWFHSAEAFCGHTVMPLVG